MATSARDRPDRRHRAELRLSPGTASHARAHALRHHHELDTAGAVFSHVRDHATRTPDALAIVDGQRRLSYQDLMRAVTGLRATLLAHGVTAGDTIASLGPRSASTPVVFLAAESLGACYLPLDPSSPTERVHEVLTRADAAALLDYTGATTSPAHDAADRAGVPVVRPPEEPSGDELEAQQGDRGDEIRYLFFTSGSTGHPKGALVEHRGMLNHLWAKILDLSLTSRDVVAFTAPLVFDISVWQMLCPLLVGGTVAVANDTAMRFPRWLISTLEATGTTVVELVPTMIGWLVDETGRLGSPVGTRLRWLLSTGEELHPGLAARVRTALPGVGLLNAYGPTECSDDVTHHVIAESDLQQDRLPVGSPVANTSLYLLTEERDGWRACAPGESGELFVGGTGVGLGYVNDPENTDRAFFRDPFDPESATGRLYRTGDLAKFHNGLVWYLGRNDRQVKISGVRMELDEIEAVLRQHPAVHSCAVTVSDFGDGPELTAHYQAREPVTATELRATLSTRLPDPMIPRQWRAWDALPLTPNGKLDHRTLRAAAAPRKEAR